MATAEASATLLPPYFPLGLSGPCSTVAETFFKLFTESSVYEKDPNVSRIALSKLGPELTAYKQCMEKHLQRKELNRAPSHYTDQVAAVPAVGGAPAPATLG